MQNDPGLRAYLISFADFLGEMVHRPNEEVDEEVENVGFELAERFLLQGILGDLPFDLVSKHLGLSN